MDLCFQDQKNIPIFVEIMVNATYLAYNHILQDKHELRFTWDL